MKFLCKILPGFMLVAFMFGSASMANASTVSSTGHHAAGISRTVSGDRQVDGKSCPWKYSWKVSTIGGWTYVVWDTNPCGFIIQAKAEFTNALEQHYWNYSGFCKRVGLQCKVNADSVLDEIDLADRRINFGVNWYPWRQYWPTSHSAKLTAFSPENPRVLGTPYSAPEFCSDDFTTYTLCINSTRDGITSGTRIQMWGHNVQGNTGNTFEAYKQGTVSGTWPFHNHTFDRAYRGEAVVEFSYIGRGHHDLCVSTLDANEHRDSNGSIYWSPIELKKCSPSVADDYDDTYFVWYHTGVGARIKSVDLTNDENSVNTLSCIYVSSQPDCVNGSIAVTIQRAGAPVFAHYDEASNHNHEGLPSVSTGGRTLIHQ